MFSEPLNFLLLLAAAVFVGVYICVPILHTLWFWVSAPRVTQASALELFPPEVVAAMTKHFPGLAAGGFRCSVHIGNYVASSLADCYLSLWINSETTDIARVIVFRLRASGRLITTMTFTQDYADGTCIVTGGSSGPSGAAVIPPSMDSLAVPGADLPHLWAVHQHRTATRRGGRAPAIGTDPIAYLNKAGTEISDYSVSRGRLRYNPVIRRYRPTLKGAFIATLATLPPMRQINAHRRTAKAEAIVREMGFASLAQFRKADAGFGETGVR